MLGELFAVFAAQKPPAPTRTPHPIYHPTARPTEGVSGGYTFLLTRSLGSQATHGRSLRVRCPIAGVTSDPRTRSRVLLTRSRGRKRPTCSLRIISLAGVLRTHDRSLGF